MQHKFREAMGNRNILNILQHLWILSNIYSFTILLICNIVTKNSNILILRLQLYCDNDIIMNIISGLNIVLSQVHKFNIQHLLYQLLPECILNMCLLIFQALDFSLNCVPHCLQFLVSRSICVCEEFVPPLGP